MTFDDVTSHLSVARQERINTSLRPGDWELRLEYAYRQGGEGFSVCQNSFHLEETEDHHP